jgi:hypothetical protein
MTAGRYAALVAALTLGGVLATALVVTPSFLPAVALGAFLSGANTVAAFFLVTWAQGKATGTFMTAVLGGMMVRMALMLGAVVFVLKAVGLPRMPFVISLLGSFVAFLALELWFLPGRRPATVEAR